MPQELAGRIALVTGAGRGLGEAVCRTLVAVGAAVVAADLRPESAEGLAAELRRSCAGAVRVPSR
jgi:2,3-dihydro-2,3-dihydroxybenzoate dehydrogenase